MSRAGGNKANKILPKTARNPKTRDRTYFPSRRAKTDPREVPYPTRKQLAPTVEASENQKELGGESLGSCSEEIVQEIVEGSVECEGEVERGSEEVIIELEEGNCESAVCEAEEGSKESAGMAELGDMSEMLKQILEANRRQMMDMLEAMNTQHNKEVTLRAEAEREHDERARRAEEERDVRLRQMEEDRMREMQELENLRLEEEGKRRQDDRERREQDRKAKARKEEVTVKLAVFDQFKDGGDLGAILSKFEMVMSECEVEKERWGAKLYPRLSERLSETIRPLYEARASYTVEGGTAWGSWSNCYCFWKADV